MRSVVLHRHVPESFLSTHPQQVLWIQARLHEPVNQSQWSLSVSRQLGQ